MKICSLCQIILCVQNKSDPPISQRLGKTVEALRCAVKARGRTVWMQKMLWLTSAGRKTTCANAAQVTELKPHGRVGINQYTT